MSKFYCKYCGIAFASVLALTNARCLNNPSGKNLSHVVYEGGEKWPVYIAFVTYLDAPGNVKAAANF